MAAPRHTLDQLAALDAIARTGSFAAAGRELGRVPSAISYAVRTLEEALGVALFDRSGQRAVLTPAGEQLLQRARAVLTEARGLEVLAFELEHGWESELRIVVDGALPMAPVQAAVGALVAGAAPTRIRLHVEYQEGVVARFFDGDGDLMLLLDADERAANLPTTLLPPLEMVLVCAADHPLAGGEVDDDALAREVSIVVQDSSPAFARTPREVFLAAERVLYVSDFATKGALIAQGVGYGWMPCHQVQAQLGAGLAEVQRAAGSRWTYRPRLVEDPERTGGRARALFVEALGRAVGHQEI
jgi:DNA-binding transcriptional LysR family regulator